jgi:DeoR/GlpR family transcriptional regulator of sugar metabolism
VKDDRATVIRQYLFANGHSAVQDIADAVGASLATVRRDLMELEADGAIERTHGGARIAGRVATELAFGLRESHQIAQKRAIADAAYDRLVPGTALFLDAGTTVLQLARRMRLDPMPLTVFTNCLPVAQILMDVAPIKVTLLGGSLRAENASMVGALAEDMLERLWFSQLFLGAGAIAEDGSVTSVDEQEARLNARMMERTDQVLVLADAGKFGQRLTYRVGRLRPPVEIITDSALGAEWTGRLAAFGVPVTRAAPAARAVA